MADDGIENCGGWRLSGRIVVAVCRHRAATDLGSCWMSCCALRLEHFAHIHDAVAAGRWANLIIFRGS